MIKKMTMLRFMVEWLWLWLLPPRMEAQCDGIQKCNYSAGMICEAVWGCSDLRVHREDLRS